MSRQHLLCAFPKLRNDSLFRIIDPDPSHPIHKYNCFAYALGETEAFWGPQHTWPQELNPRLDSPDHIDSYIELFEYYKYERCSEIFGVRPDHLDFGEGVDKVALYAMENSANGVKYLQCPHVAKQLPSGRWSSKNNQFDIFEHALESLESEPGNAIPQAYADECKETHPDGVTITYRLQNCGQLVLVMSRHILNG
jgi:hypothetical protein